MTLEETPRLYLPISYIY